MAQQPKTAFQEQVTGRKSQAKAKNPPESTVVAGRPRMPKYLTGFAEERWRELIRILRRRGVLTTGDGPLIELACNTYARLREAQNEIEEHGLMVTVEWEGKDGNIYTKRQLNPAAKVAATYESQHRAQLNDLCTTVSSRDRVKPAPTPEVPNPPKEQTPEERFLSSLGDGATPEQQTPEHGDDFEVSEEQLNSITNPNEEAQP